MKEKKILFKNCLYISLLHLWRDTKVNITTQKDLLLKLHKKLNRKGVKEEKNERENRPMW